MFLLENLCIFEVFCDELVVVAELTCWYLGDQLFGCSIQIFEQRYHWIPWLIMSKFEFLVFWVVALNDFNKVHVKLLLSFCCNPGPIHVFLQYLWNQTKKKTHNICETKKKSTKKLTVFLQYLWVIIGSLAPFHNRVFASLLWISWHYSIIGLYTCIAFANPFMLHLYWRYSFFFLTCFLLVYSSL